MELQALTTVSIILVVFLTHYSYSEGLKITGRIIKGKLAKDGQFPWQVILKKVGQNESACGASLISSKWVLSAGHCIEGLNEIFLMFGSTHLVNIEAQNMTSKELYLHPKYDKENIDHDLSLIKLPKSVKFDEHVRSIALPSRMQENETFLGTAAAVSGFGLRDDTSFKAPDRLYYTHVTIINNTECAHELRRKIFDNSLCSEGFQNSESICNGDSGSALVTKDENDHWMQIGVNSFVASGDCENGYPSGYARVTKFFDWIEEVTNITIK